MRGGKSEWAFITSRFDSIYKIIRYRSIGLVNMRSGELVVEC